MFFITVLVASLSSLYATGYIPGSRVSFMLLATYTYTSAFLMRKIIKSLENIFELEILFKKKINSFMKKIHLSDLFPNVELSVLMSVIATKDFKLFNKYFRKLSKRISKEHFPLLLKEAVKNGSSNIV